MSTFSRLEELLKKLEELDHFFPSTILCATSDHFKALKEGIRNELKEAVWADYLAKGKGG